MQGFNMGRYYPPDAVNPPTFNASSHPLGKRASKISEGVLTVRFELPFAVWCDHCAPPAIVGQGVRFNAEKKKVGNYYTTPIWSFRMKHGACGGWWEIRTDPKNAAYVVVEGAKKRDYGPEDEGAEADGERKFLTQDEKERRRNDAFANLEGKTEEKGAERKNKERVEELYDKSAVWEDPYLANARLRKQFRDQRRVWRKEEQHKERMQEKFSLAIDISDETEADRMHASLADFAVSNSNNSSTHCTVWKPLFQDAKADKNMHSISTAKKIKSEQTTEKTRVTLQQVLVGNTKTVIDPFMNNANNAKMKAKFGTLKRKPCTDSQTKTDDSMSSVTPNARKPMIESKKPRLCFALVDYGSD
ncbi:CWC16 protein [Phaeosphaeriaceae sp. PMI808]|nr:CWC16 protein [Phaeosphaeriaceae sp. PMI808]